MTNFDCVTMDVDVLSKFLSRSMNCYDCWNYTFCHKDENKGLSCEDVWVKWLLEDC